MNIHGLEFSFLPHGRSIGMILFYSIISSIDHIFLVSVASVEQSLCTSTGPYPVPFPEGYIASSIAREKRCGSMRVPWRIEATPGQSINISLINYTPTERVTGGHCDALGYVYDVTQKNNVTICNTASTYSHVYVSISHIVEVQIVLGMEDNRFLLEYDGKCRIMIITIH